MSEEIKEHSASVEMEPVVKLAQDENGYLSLIPLDGMVREKDALFYSAEQLAALQAEITRLKLPGKNSRALLPLLEENAELQAKLEQAEARIVTQHEQLRSALNYIECDCSEDENIPEAVWASIQAWPKIDSTALEAHDKGVREKALEEAKQACLNELLSTPTDSEGDIAYQNAINDCVRSIEELLEER